MGVKASLARSGDSEGLRRYEAAKGPAAACNDRRRTRRSRALGGDGGGTRRCTLAACERDTRPDDPDQPQEVGHLTKVVERHRGEDQRDRRGSECAPAERPSTAGERERAGRE